MGNLGPRSNQVATPRGSFKSSIPNGLSDSGIELDGTRYVLRNRNKSLWLSGLYFFLDVTPTADIFAEMTTQWSPTSLNSSGMIRAEVAYEINSTILSPSSSVAFVQGNGDGQTGSGWQLAASSGICPTSHVGVGSVYVFGYFRFSLPQAYDMFVRALFPRSSVRFEVWRPSHNWTSYLVNDGDSDSVWNLLDV
jgi:hypothetical protein